MIRSACTILTTHGGGLPVPPELVTHMEARRAAAPDDAVLARAVKVTVERQRECGIQIVNDGDLSRVDRSLWLRERFVGFDGVGKFPHVADGKALRELLPPEGPDVPACVGEVRYKGLAHVQRDITNLRAALSTKPVDEAFLCSDSPGLVALLHENHFYPSSALYLTALADALHEEYSAIHRAGFILQVDCSDLALLGHVGPEPPSGGEIQRRTELHVTALNHALRGIPPSRARLSLCWGNYAAPHQRDLPLRDIIQSVLRARPAGIAFAAANPRHEHEWQVWGDMPLRHSKILIPGVIDTTSVYVEHPELVAERILRFARSMGALDLIAGTDSGFHAFGPFPRLEADVAWQKLSSLVEGARLAGAELVPLRKRSEAHPAHH
ncbi:MAG: hypothetical protein IPI67_23100 [Myxococcales bacterium]|nr:hypothetical protein [Myxococcales bacterium]